MDSNLLSGFVGAVLGAIASFCVAVYANKKQVAAIAKERRLNLLTDGFILTGKFLESFKYYKPNLLSGSRFGMKLTEDYEFKIRESISIYQELKSLTHLMPFELRNRWIEAQDLVHKFNCQEFKDSESLQIAELETRNYLVHLHNSILDLLEDRDLRDEIQVPIFDGSTLRLDGEIEDIS